MPRDAGGGGSFSDGVPLGRHDALISGTAPDVPRILIVENDQSVADFLVTFLKGEGYEPSVASSLEMALERLDEQTFHLVLTDLFRTNPRHPFSQVRPLLQHAPPTPVGLMTGWQIPPEVASRQGFAFLLPKPFDLDHLLTAITACLKQTFTPEQQQQLEVLQHFIETVLTTGNLGTMGQFLTDDIAYYPPQRAQSFNTKRIKGWSAFQAYALETLAYYQNVVFDGFLFYPRPKGWVLRFRSHWSDPEGTLHKLAGTLLFHFRGNQIYRVRTYWNNRRLSGVLEQ